MKSCFLTGLILASILPTSTKLFAQETQELVEKGRPKAMLTAYESLALFLSKTELKDPEALVEFAKDSLKLQLKKSEKGQIKLVTPPSVSFDFAEIGGEIIEAVQGTLQTDVEKSHLNFTSLDEDEKSFTIAADLEITNVLDIHRWITEPRDGTSSVQSASSSQYVWKIRLLENKKDQAELLKEEVLHFGSGGWVEAYRDRFENLLKYFNHYAGTDQGDKLRTGLEAQIETMIEKIQAVPKNQKHQKHEAWLTTLAYLQTRLKPASVELTNLEDRDLDRLYIAKDPLILPEVLCEIIGRAIIDYSLGHRVEE